MLSEDGPYDPSILFPAPILQELSTFSKSQSGSLLQLYNLLSIRERKLLNKYERLDENADYIDYCSEVLILHAAFKIYLDSYSN